MSTSNQPESIVLPELMGADRLRHGTPYMDVALRLVDIGTIGVGLRTIIYGLDFVGEAERYRR